MKICTICKQSKTPEEFYKKGEKGLVSSCKPCHNTSALKSYYRHKKQRLIMCYAWNKAHPEARKNASNKANWKKQGFNLSIDDYNKLIISQNGLCGICKLKPKDRLCVDHNHKTGIIRGLLCRKCNSALGLFQENKYFLINAINWLD